MNEHGQDVNDDHLEDREHGRYGGQCHAHALKASQLLEECHDDLADHDHGREGVMVLSVGAAVNHHNGDYNRQQRWWQRI